MKWLRERHPHSAGARGAARHPNARVNSALVRPGRRHPKSKHLGEAERHEPVAYLPADDDR